MHQGGAGRSEKIVRRTGELRSLRSGVSTVSHTFAAVSRDLRKHTRTVMCL